MNQQPPQPPPLQPQASPPPPSPQGPAYYGAPPLPPKNPGKVFGIVSIVLSIVAMPIIGLALAIVSIVKSSRARASKALGITSLIISIISIILFTFLIFYLLNSKVEDLGKKIERGEGITIGRTSITLDKQYKPAKGVAVWRHSQLPSGWSEVSSVDGVHTYKDNQGGILTSQSMQMSDAGSGSDKTLSEKYANQIESELTKDATNLSKQVKTKAILHIDGTDKLLYLTLIKRTYTNKQGEQKQSIIAARAYDGDKLLVLIYTGYEKDASSGPGETVIRQFYVKEGSNAQY